MWVLCYEYFTNKEYGKTDWATFGPFPTKEDAVEYYNIQGFLDDECYCQHKFKEVTK